MEKTKEKFENSKELFSGLVENLDFEVINKGIIIEDNISINGLELSCGSDTLDGYISPYDATLIEKLKDSDYQIIGKSKIDEFGVLEPGEDTKRTIHKLIDLKIADFGIGTDTDSFLAKLALSVGISSFMPSRGLISYYGVVSSTSNFTRLSLLGKDLDGIENIFETIKGIDERDLNTIELNNVENENSEYKILTLKDFEINKGLLEKLNIDNKEVELEYSDYIVSAYKTIFAADISSSLSKYDGLRFGKKANAYKDFNDMYSKTRALVFSQYIKNLIITGNYVLSQDYIDEYYNKSILVKNKTEKELDSILDNNTFIILPLNKEDNNMLNTVLVNFANLASITIPINKDFGIQIISKRLNDNNLIKFAKYIEGKIDEI